VDLEGEVSEEGQLHLGLAQSGVQGDRLGERAPQELHLVAPQDLIVILIIDRDEDIMAIGAIPGTDDFGIRLFGQGTIIGRGTILQLM
jgi:hypothetical protein